MQTAFPLRRMETIHQIEDKTPWWWSWPNLVSLPFCTSASSQGARALDLGAERSQVPIMCCILVCTGVALACPYAPPLHMHKRTHAQTYACTSPSHTYSTPLTNAHTFARSLTSAPPHAPPLTHVHIHLLPPLTHRYAHPLTCAHAPSHMHTPWMACFQKSNCGRTPH